MREIQTGRLLLRQWRDPDRKPFAVMGADPAVMRYFPRLLDEGQSAALAARIRSRIDSDGWGLWAVEVVDPGSPLLGRFIGFAGLAPVHPNLPFSPALEVGWRLSPAAWGNGYATEAAGAALGVAFGELRVDEVVSMTSALNSPSRAVMKRLGMTRDPVDDFAHPSVAEGDELREHVLYRLRRPGGSRRGAAVPRS